MTSKTELKEMIEALRDEIRGLRLDVANLQTMVRDNQNKSTEIHTYIPWSGDTDGYPKVTYTNKEGISCTSTSKNSDDKIITATNC